MISRKLSVGLGLLFLATPVFSQQMIKKLDVEDLKLSKESAGTALYLDTLKKIKSLTSVSDTEMGYLDGVTSPIQTQLNAKEGTISAGTTSQYYRGDKTFQNLDKNAVGLPLVDNTSDASKPVSTAQQTALNLKADIASPSLTGDPKAPTPTVGDNDTSIATTGFVTGAIATATPADATTSSKGIVQLAGDLAGTAASPTVPGLALKAPLASPALTGTPTAPTATAGTNTTQLATTQFVTTAVSTTAADSSVVHLSGAETITGAKTFSGRMAASSTTFGNKPCPDMTDTQMLAIASPNNGDCVFNTTKKSAYFYDSVGLKWKLTGGSGNGDVETAFTQDFENASLTDFTVTGGGVANILLINLQIHGDASARLAHDTPTANNTNTFKQAVSLDTKFRGRNLTMRFECSSTASYGNVTLKVRDETNATDLVVSEVVNCPNPNLVTYTDSYFVTFDVPATTTSISYKFSGAPEVLDGPKNRLTIVDDIVIYTTKNALLSTSVTVPKPVENSFGAKVSSTAAVSDKVNTMFSTCSVASSVYTCPFSGLTNPPNCTPGMGPLGTQVQVTTLSASQIIYTTYNSSGAITPVNVTWNCEKTGTDYIDPTTSTQSKTIQLTQAGVYQEPDSNLFLENFTIALASTNTQIITLGTPVIQTTKGLAITYLKDAVLGDTIKTNSDGIYSFTINLDSNITTGAYGLSIDSNQLTTAYVSLTDANKLAMSTFGEIQTLNWTGYIPAGKTIRLHNQGLFGTSESAARMNLSVTYQGSLKQVNVNKNSKIKIPTSEVRFEGATSRGSTNTSVVIFTAITRLVGDAFDINPDGAGSAAVLGTHVKMKKSGWLCADGNLYLGPSGGYTYLTRNQTTSLSTGAEPTIASEILKSAGASNSSAPYLPTMWCGLASNGDYIRLTASSNPTNDVTNHLHLSFFETEVQVSVSNTLPQYSDSDIILRAAGSSGAAITADVTNIPFTTVSDTSGVWNGSQYTVPETGLYSVSPSVYCTTAASRTAALYVNGSLYRYVGQTSAINLYQGTISDKFTAGQILSIRLNGSGCTLSTDANAHWLNISKVGKPNVTGVDVTPFVNSQAIIRDEIRLSGHTGYGSTSTAMMRFTTKSYSADAGVIQYVSDSVNGDYIKAVVDCDVTGNVDVNVPSGLPYTFAGVFDSLSTVTLATFSVGATFYASSSQWASVPSGTQVMSLPIVAHMVAGQMLRISTSSTSVTAVRLNLNAVANSTQVVTPVESFSVDATDFVYAPSTTYTLSTLSSAPKGTYITYTGGASAQCDTQSTTIPTGQTDAQIKAQGFLLTSKVFTAAGTPNAPCRFDIQIGKGYKGTKIDMYTGAGRTGNSVNYDFFSDSAGRDVGVATSYNETTGVLTVNAGYAWASNSTRWLGTTAGSGTATTTAYVYISASKTPTLSGISYVSPRVAYLSDVKPANTNAGGPATGALWTARTLNTEDDASDFLTLSASQFTLPAGEYIIEGTSPAHSIALHKTRIRGTDGVTYISGSSEFATTNIMTRSTIIGRIVLTGSKTFELQHYTQNAGSVNGFGVATNAAENEVYAQLKITKVK